MLADIDFSWLPTPPESLPVRVLLAVGITAAGGLLAGILVQVLSKVATRSTAPRPAVNLVRLGGAGAAGLAAALWLFSSGLGPGKGPGLGPGTGKGDGEEHAGNTSDKDKKPPDDGKKPPDTPAGETVLEIVVLAPETVLRIADQEAVDRERRFRVKTEDGWKLMSLGEIENYIVTLDNEKKTPDQVKLVKYRAEGQPEDQANAKAQLTKMARELKNIRKDRVRSGWVDDQLLSGKPPL
jgi:hypothetical protein